MREEVLFKKTPFGGFDRESVINYIQQLKKTQLEYKNMLAEKDETIRKLSADNADFSERVKKAEAENTRLSAKCSEAEEDAKKMRAKYEMIVNQKEESADKKAAKETIERCDKLVASAQAAADKLQKNAQSKIKKSIKKIEKAKDTPEKAKEVLQELIRELS